MGDLLEKEKHKRNTLPFFEHSKAVWGTRSGWLIDDMWPKKVDPGSMSVGEAVETAEGAGIGITHAQCVQHGKDGVWRIVNVDSLSDLSPSPISVTYQLWDVGQIA